MSNSPHHPDPQALRQFLLGRLAADELERLAEHVEGCAACQQQLQQLNEDDVLLAAMKTAALKPSPPPLPPELVERVRGLGPRHDDTCITDARGFLARLRETPADATQEIYDFLAPPQQPGELGRLGPFRVLRVLGAGGMGVVFEAEDTQRQRRVALKALRPALAVSPSAQRRFLLEGEAGAALQHKHVVPIYQVGADRGIPFLAMPLLEGESLEERLQSAAPLAADEVVRIGREIAEALAAAQANGVIHRDVKPSNVWLEAPDGHVRLLDFGLARAMSGAANLTHSGVIVGTPAYMSPEQARGEPVDPRSDLFSLGCVLYRACTGRLPFAGNTAVATLLALVHDQPPAPQKLNPRCPPPLSRLIMKLLAKRPDDRPASARAVVAALEAIADGREEPRRHRWRLGLMLVIPLLLAGVGLLVYRPEPAPSVFDAEPALASLYEAGVNYPAGLYPQPVALADFNRDGKLDLAVGNVHTQTVSVLLGRGDGSFAAPLSSPAQAWHFAALGVGDFNGDGIPDVAGCNNGVSILLGRGDGSFQPPLQHEVGRNPNGIAVADLDRDGKVDLTVASGDGSVSILRGKGNGTFFPAVTIALGDSCRGVLVADLDHDGWLDLIVGGRGRVYVLLSQGAGAFHPAASYPSADGVESLAGGDFNGDGHLDLVGVDNGTNGGVRILFGQGDGSFGPPRWLGSGLSCMDAVVADFDGDGRLDIGITSDTGAAATGSIRLLRGNGDGTFQPPTDLGVGRKPWGLVVGDLNGDGTPDLVCTNRDSNHVSVLLQRPRIPYQVHLGPAEHYPAGMEPRALALGDFNGDGRLEVAVADYAGAAVHVLCNDGATLQAAPACPAGRGPTALAAGDLDGDGRLDLAVADAQSSTVSVLLGHGDGTFGKATNYAVGKKPVALVLGDLDGDGRLDVVTANDDGDSVSILLGRGGGAFHPARTQAIGSRPRALVLGDFDRDGKLDLVVANFAQSGQLKVLLGNGDGTFAPPTAIAIGPSPLALVAADFNRDGRLDLAVANHGSTDVNVLLGAGDGTFGPPANYPLRQQPPAALTTADVDGDGVLDLLVAMAGEPYAVGLLLGRGDGTFPHAPRYFDVGIFPTSLAAGRLRPGAHVDVVTANAHSSSVSVLRNRAAVPFLRLGFQTEAIDSDGMSYSLEVSAHDAGATAHDRAYRGTLVFESSDPDAQLPEPYTFTAAGRRPRFQARLRTHGGQTITVRAASGSHLPATASLLVLRPSDLRFRLEAPREAIAGVPFRLILHVMNPFGGWTNGYAGNVSFRCTDAEAKLPDDHRSNAAAVQAFPGCTLSRPGRWTVTVIDPDQPALSASATVIARRP